MNITLHGFRSSRSTRAVWALEEVGAEYTYAHVNFASGAHLSDAFGAMLRDGALEAAAAVVPDCRSFLAMFLLRATRYRFVRSTGQAVWMSAGEGAELGEGLELGEEGGDSHGFRAATIHAGGLSVELPPRGSSSQ